MRRFLALLTVLMLSGVLAYSQTRLVTGKVVDEKGNAVPFASVKIENSNVGTSTSSDGSFAIRANDNTVLVVSSTGYAPTTVKVGEQSFVGISLKSTNTSLQEVVVTTALGQVRQKSSLGYSTVKIDNTSITQGHSTNAAQGLTAKASGVSIQQTNSGVRQDTRITLRGIRSLTGSNQPMLILDGVPLSLGYFNSINPNDILDINILKSNTSTAIYGPEGANGAIIVTTKRGSRQRPMISVSHSVQTESISYMPKFQQRWGAGYDLDPSTGLGTYEPHEQQSWGDEFDGSIRQLGDPGPDGDTLFHTYSYRPGERKRFWNTGVTNQTDVSYSTGDFYLSGQNASIKGTIPGDELDRRAITFRSEKEYNKFKAILNLRYTQTKDDITTANSAMYYGVISAPGSVPLTNYSDWRNDFRSSPNGYYTVYLSNNGLTPYFAKDTRRQKSRTEDLFGNVELNYKATDWLNFVYRVGLTNTNREILATTEAFTPSAHYYTRPDVSAGTAVQTAAVANQNDGSSRVTSEFFTNLNKKVKDFEFSATLGHTFRESRTRLVNANSTNLGQSAFLSIQTRLGEPNVSVSNSVIRLQRFFGRLSVNYKKWLFGEMIASYDRDSKLAPVGNTIQDVGRISYFYPAYNAAILLHEVIPGLKDNKVMNYLKVRAAYAKTGNTNAISAYQNETAFGVSTFFPYGSTPGYTLGTTVYQAGGLNPEFISTTEVGLELGFLKNRIAFEASYFTQDNTDQILDVRLPNSSGFTVKTQNAAAFENKGLELDLKLNPLIRVKDVSINFSANYTYIKSKITSLTDGVPFLGLGNYNYAVVGYPAFVFRFNDYVRDSATGKVIVDRRTGMPTINPNLTQFGQTMPEHVLGLNLNVNWKGFNLAIVGQYSTGNYIVADQLGQQMDNNGISLRSGDFGRRAFIFPNSVVDDGTGKLVPNTSIYTTQYGRLFYNNDINTAAISNYYASGAFWKLREVSLTYDLPSNLFKGNVLKGAQVGLSGRNLFMWLPKSNQWTDPEFTSNGNNAYTGNAIGRSTLYNSPPTRFIGANVKLQF